MAIQLRFTHHRAWRFGRAVPACMEEPKERLMRAVTTTRQEKITCGQCIAKLQDAGLWNGD